jgi:nitrous oxidase accessory protein NosD
MSLTIGLLVSSLVLASPGPAAQRVSPYPRPATVWVDDDFGTGTPGWGRTHFATIADGVLHVTAGGRVEVAAGTYPEALVLTKRVHLEGEGPYAATIAAVPGEGNMLTILSAGTSVRGLRFLGDGQPRTAVLVRGADRCTVAGNELVGGGLAIQVWQHAAEVSDGVIADNLGVEALQVGIASYTYPVRRFRIERNQAHRIRLELGVDSLIAGNEVETLASAPTSGGIQLYDCTASEARDNTVHSTDAGISVVTGSANAVVGNRIVGPFYTGVHGRHAHDVVVRDNVLVGEAASRGILLAYTDRAQVVGNQVTLPAGAAGVFLVECESARFEQNALMGGGLVIRGELAAEWDSHLVTDSTFAGLPIHYEVGTTGSPVPLDRGQVILAYCSGFSIEGLRFPPGAPGVQLAACTAGVVRDCTFLQGGPNALYAWESEELEVAANAFLDVPEDGLESPTTISMERCRACTLRDNTLASSSPYTTAGMTLLDCEALEIVGNAIANHWLPLLLRYGQGGHVLHHNAICAYQAIVDDCGSTWDDGQGSGNYWDDYGGVDADGDGVGDTPHQIHLGLADAHPLILPPTGALLWSDRHVVSAGAGGTSRFVLEAGRLRAGLPYLILGSASGTSPGTWFANAHVPLVPDAYFRELLAHPGAPGYVGFRGCLDADGRAEPELTLPADPGLAGTTLHHAACVIVLEPTQRRPALAIRVEAVSPAVPLYVLE